MSDDVSMNALSGTIAERSRAALAAGCDIVLHCNGNMAEMTAVAGEAPSLSGKAEERTIGALARRAAPQEFDTETARTLFARMVSDERAIPERKTGS